MKQTAYALYVRNDDLAAVFALCRETAEQEFRPVCYQGSGGDAAIKSSKYVIGDAAQAATTHQLTRAQASQGVPPPEGAHQHTSEANTL